MEVLVDSRGNRLKQLGQLWIDRQDEWYNVNLYDPSRVPDLGLYRDSGCIQPLTGAPICSIAGPFAVQFETFGKKPTSGFHEPVRKVLGYPSPTGIPTAATVGGKRYRTLDSYIHTTYSPLAAPFDYRYWGRR